MALVQLITQTFATLPSVEFELMVLLFYGIEGGLQKQETSNEFHLTLEIVTKIRNTLRSEISYC